MQPNQLLGLVKFFSNEDYLSKLINGLFYCSPPEIYRLEKREGVSDRFESCRYSYRLERDGRCTLLKFNDIDMSEDTVAFTVQSANHKDSWMHCWFSLRVPENEDALNLLNADIDRMKNEFGNKIAIIPAVQIKPFIGHLQKLSAKPLFCGFVEYEEYPDKWGVLCKSTQYAYQREYRFLFGECSTHEVKPYILNDKKGFGEFIYRGESLKLTSKNGENVWLDMGA